MISLQSQVRYLDVLEMEATGTSQSRNVLPCAFGYAVCLFIPLNRKYIRTSDYLCSPKNLPARILDKLNDLSKASVQSIFFVPVLGSVRLTFKLAMQSAALFGIELLYRLGTLDENLLPRRKDLLDETALMADLFLWRTLNRKDTKAVFSDPSCEREIKHDESLFIPRELADPINISECKSLFVTIFDVKADDLEKNAQSVHRMALLTKSPLPNINSMILYHNGLPLTVSFKSWDSRASFHPGAREARANVSNNEPEIELEIFKTNEESSQLTAVSLSQEQLAQIKAFQLLFWGQIFAPQKDKIQPDHQAYFFVPIVGNISEDSSGLSRYEWHFDFNLVQNLRESKECAFPRFLEIASRNVKSQILGGRKRASGKEDSLLDFDSVFTAACNGIEVSESLATFAERDMATRVCKQAILRTQYRDLIYSVEDLDFYLTPGDLMSADNKDPAESQSFAAYLKKRHGFHIEDETKAPMIEARLLPVEPRNFFVMKTADSRDGAKIHLVPQTCRILPIPRDIFVQSQMIPSISHHIKQICVVDQFRTNLGIADLTNETLFEAFSSTVHLQVPVLHYVLGCR